MPTPELELGVCWTGENFTGELRMRSEMTFCDERYITGTGRKVQSSYILEVEMQIKRKCGEPSLLM